LWEYVLQIQDATLQPGWIADISALLKASVQSTEDAVGMKKKRMSRGVSMMMRQNASCTTSQELNAASLESMKNNVRIGVVAGKNQIHQASLGASNLDRWQKDATLLV
jgi:hypothetical protein